MTLALRTAAPLRDPSLAALLTLAFDGRTNELRLVEALERGSPSFDPGMSLVATHDGEPAGYALFLPREMKIYGTWVKLAVSAPFGVRPELRGAGGVGRFLLRAGIQALRDRGIRGAVVLGGQDFFAKHGYASAFNLYTLRAARGLVAPAGDDGWRGLRPDDLAPIQALLHACYAETSGTERRAPAALEFESSVPHGHTLVLEDRGTVEAYLRFRVGRVLDVRECGARSERGIAALLGLLARLTAEHGREAIDVHVPPQHPLALELFQRGAPLTSSNFHGAAMLDVVDWRGFLCDLAPALGAALGAGTSLSLELEGRSWVLSPGAPSSARTAGPEPREGRAPGAHLVVPAGWAAGLFTGQRSWRDLARSSAARERSELDEAGWAAVRRLFPGGDPQWTYSPVFELADE
jgi:predicted N-acetyltransferase YhbS